MPSAAIIGGGGGAAAGGSSSSRLPKLPAGFRFHPTDEELIVHYLMNQAASVPCPVPIIAEVNIYQCNPWDLPAKALFGENEWYFFSPRDRKYPNGARPNRAAGSGYWKATGTDKAILSSASGDLRVGVKKALVFYSGKPPRGAKTDWIMHEYRLTATASTPGKSTAASKPRGSSTSMRLDDWVLCRIYKKSNDFQQLSDQEEQDGSASTVEEDSALTTNNINTAALASPNPKSSPQQDKPFDHDQFRQTAMAMMTKSCSLTDLFNTIDCSALSQMLLLDAPAAEPDEPQQQSPLIYYPTTTTTAAQTNQSLNYNNSSLNNSHVSNNFPFVDASSSDHNNNNSGLKRKRTMAMGGGAESLDDGSNNNGFSSSKKLKLLLPSDSRSGGGHFFAAGSTSNGSSYYCNQQRQLADTTTSSSGVFQYSTSLLSSNPFLSHHQMLLSSHLEMQ